jgi:hypothetical protein
MTVSESLLKPRDGKGVHDRFEPSKFALRLSAQQFEDVSIAVGLVQETGRWNVTL